MSQPKDADLESRLRLSKRDLAQRLIGAEKFAAKQTLALEAAHAREERLRRALEKADIAIEYQLRGQSNWTLEKVTKLLNEASDAVKEALTPDSAEGERS